MPPIWRRIQVPSGYSFYQMHHAIQQAMGWMGHHLHQFTIVNPETEAMEQIVMPQPEPDYLGFGDDNINVPEITAMIAKYFASPEAKAIYEYDFGDGWEHEVELEMILPGITGDDYPKCTGGRRACPPDGCGGVWGYAELLKIIADPTHEEYQERMEWIESVTFDEAFSPEKFDPKAVVFDDFLMDHGESF